MWTSLNKKLYVFMSIILVIGFIVGIVFVVLAVVLGILYVI